MVGKTLGPYKILEQLGKGGMGEVWLAEDTRLDRKVAVKVLPADLASDVDRRQRFEQEAKAAAALNHPNIAAIHDVGVEETEGTPIHYMVQEYLQGETLREVISRGPLPFDKVTTIAIEIGEALKAAHRAGIVHRDLKPDNIFINNDGHAKVLDFGLAKLTEMALPSGAPSMSPTMTMAGQMLGTAGYMAPEQVRGEEVDERADLFAFGCVLYEMITGQQAFGGDNVHASLARILTGEPDPIQQGSGSTLQCGWIFSKLLAKDREQRYQSAADVVVDLRRLVAAGDSGVAPPVAAAVIAEPGPPARRSPAMLVVVAVAAVILGALAAWNLKQSPAAPSARDVRFEIMLPAKGVMFSANYNRIVTISPDGTTVAYTANALWLRTLSQTEPRPVANTESARSPTFSADSRQVAFWEKGHIKRVALEADVPIVVGPLHERPFGMNWAADGYIYFGRADRGIWRIPATGGDPEVVLELAAGEQAHGPELLAGGEWMIFTLGRSVRAWADGSIVAQSLTTNERRVLVQHGREARYTRNGYLTFVREGSLFAAPFDPAEVEVTGAAVVLENNVHTSVENETGAAGYDVSDDGVLAFVPQLGTGAGRLVFIDRDMHEELLPMGARNFADAALSPDQKFIAAQINDLEGTHIWIFSVNRAGARRLTTTGRNTSPVWSHDGQTIYFASDRDGDTDIWSRVADLSGPSQHVLDEDGAQLPSSISGNGAWLLYSRMAPGNSDIGRLSLVGDPITEILIDGPADELDPTVSPDGEFVCFASDETGRWDVHAIEVSSGRRWVLSTDSGYSPVWTADGKRVLFANYSVGVAGVEVEIDPEFTTTDPEVFFALGMNRTGAPYDVTHDGERILARVPDETDTAAETRPRIGVVLNWFDVLERGRR